MKIVAQRSFATLVALTALACATTSATACTGIRLQAKDGAIIYGRTLEFGTDLSSNLMIIPREIAFQGTTESGKPGLTWRTKYGAAGLNGLGQTALVDGVNEKGLASGIFLMPGYAKYQQVSAEEEARSLAPWELVTWILTNFATVDEVRKALPEIKVGSVKFDGALLPLHYVVHDAAGNSLVVEYLDGALSVRDNPVGVITNSPDFDWHLKNLSNYVNLRADNAKPETIDGLKIGQFGQGSGLLGMPGDFTPPSRFVRAVILSHAVAAVETGEETVRQAFHVLDSFDIPSGAVRAANDELTAYELTQWTSATDTKNLVYYFHSYDNRRVRQLDLKKVDLNAGQVLVIPSRGQEDFDDLTPGKAGR
ncbi:MAG TPA: choloylglycine hydrolase family protein [Pirellulales bacterium]|nr:choloylglycine hydrolase family protein [Pirellulales bacterium]